MHAQSRSDRTGKGRTKRRNQIRSERGDEKGTADRMGEGETGRGSRSAVNKRKRGKSLMLVGEGQSKMGRLANGEKKRHACIFGYRG